MSYKVVAGDPAGLADVAAFLAMLNRGSAGTPWHELFLPGVDLHVARAPGRLDVMGGIADYSGALVLELPLAEATLAAVQRRPGRQLRLVSLGADAHRGTGVELTLDDLCPHGRPIEYAEARSRFSREPRDHWSAYVAGCFLVLMREQAARFADGAAVLIDSRVPEGKGVSSSAALEVATMSAVAAAFGLELPAVRTAVLCQKVENLVVGAPCGIMDQMTSACGRAGELLALLCQPAELQGTVAIPPGLAVWGLDSGVRHQVSGADYGSVRVGAFMGYRILADLADLEVEPGDEPGRVRVHDPRWAGYLANVDAGEFDTSWAGRLPERIDGAAFLARYGGFTDPVARIDPARSYAVRTPTAHPVHEHARVCKFREILLGGSADADWIAAGELMYASHASYSACGLGSTGTDLLVELVRAAGPAAGLYGAKITGGGSGGTVAVLGRADAEPAVRAVAGAYAARTGHHPYLFTGSSPGSAAFGTLRLVRKVR